MAIHRIELGATFNKIPILCMNINCFCFIEHLLEKGYLLIKKYMN